ncbi:MAG TPA: hypothetical protein ENH49_03380, partial [Candidatus Marinimicrobia bacterium]|nr:hypothetical protein [Candidatus Neomarinimicrobiota bacterium]
MKYLLKIIFILFLFSLLGSVQAQTNPKQSLSTILQPLAKKPVPYDALIRNLQAFQGTISGNKPGEKALRNQVRFWEYEITYRKLLSQTNPAPTAKDFKRLYDDFHSIPTANVGNKILKSWIEYKLGFCQFRLAELATDGNRAIVHYEKAAIHFNAIVPKENELYFPARVMRGICFI